MPIQQPGRGAFGRGSVSMCGQGGQRAMPGTRGLRRKIFRSPKFLGSFSVSGVTRNSSGAALPDCVVQLFLTGSNALLGQTVSDGSGNYSFSIGTNQAVYLVAYKAGAPDLGGTTVNTIQPAPV